MRKALIATATIVMLFISAAAPAASWYVDGSVTSYGDGTSWDRAFNRIQEGIYAASAGDIVVVAGGTYVENVHFKGKNIILRSADPTYQAVVESTVIDGNKADAVVTFAGDENETCVLSGFTIRNGSASEGGGIRGVTGANRTQATIQNNVIVGNTAKSGGGLATAMDSLQTT